MVLQCSRMGPVFQSQSLNESANHWLGPQYFPRNFQSALESVFTYILGCLKVFQLVQQD